MTCQYARDEKERGEKNLLFLLLLPDSIRQTCQVTGASLNSQANSFHALLMNSQSANGSYVLCSEKKQLRIFLFFSYYGKRNVLQSDIISYRIIWFRS